MDFNHCLKSVLILLGLTAAAAATYATIHKKMFRSGMITLIISNEKMNDIIKIVKSLVESNLLRKGNHESIKSKARKQKRWFFRMVIGTWSEIYQ